RAGAKFRQPGECAPPPEEVRRGAQPPRAGPRDLQEGAAAKRPPPRHQPERQGGVYGSRGEAARGARPQQRGTRHYQESIATTTGPMLGTHGQLDEARAVYERALAMNKKVLRPRYPGLAASFGNLGYVLHHQGQLGEARGHHEQALAICKKALPPFDRRLAIS